MKRLRAKTLARIWGTKSAWSLAAPRGRRDTASRECEVEVEILGEEQNGYHLVLRPAGFLSADSHHPTLEDALSRAAEFFGLREGDWATSKE